MQDMKMTDQIAGREISRFHIINYMHILKNI